VKSQKCKDKGGCYDCEGVSECWHGVSKGGSQMAISVPANSAYTSFAAIVNMKCSSSAGGHWLLKPTLLQKADLRVMINNKLWKTYNEAQMPMYRDGLLKPDNIDVIGRSHTRLRLELVPKQRSTAAKGKFSLQAFKVDASAHKCLEVTDCMNVLSQQKKQAFALRNSKRLQLQCLMGKLHSEVCDDWVKCLPADKQEILKAILRAMGAGAIGLLDLSAALSVASGKVSKTHTQDEECVDPAGDDPEAWDCDCHEKMIEVCGGQDRETCFRSQMCKHPDVCQHWKESVSCAPLASSLLQRSGSGGRFEVESNVSQKQSIGDALEERTNMSSSAGASLDSSLAGKCSSETQ